MEYDKREYQRKVNSQRNQNKKNRAYANKKFIGNIARKIIGKGESELDVQHKDLSMNKNIGISTPNRIFWKLHKSNSVPTGKFGKYFVWEKTLKDGRVIYNVTEENIPPRPRTGGYFNLEALLLRKKETFFNQNNRDRDYYDSENIGESMKYKNFGLTCTIDVYRDGWMRQCRKPAVGTVNSAVKPIEVCEEHARDFEKKGAKVHYYDTIDDKVGESKSMKYKNINPIREDNFIEPEDITFEDDSFIDDIFPDQGTDNQTGQQTQFDYAMPPQENKEEIEIEGLLGEEPTQSSVWEAKKRRNFSMKPIKVKDLIETCVERKLTKPQIMEVLQYHGFLKEGAYDSEEYDVDSIMDYESGEQDEESTIAMFQKMIDNGSVWGLQGSYGRQAMELIKSGQCILGPEGFHDYWGNYIPSRFEVKPGTKGSIEYQKKMLGESLKKSKGSLKEKVYIVYDRNRAR